MASLDWDSFRHVLAIGDAGSLAGAARALNVNHTTVLRRLDALEQSLGTRLFDRQRSGYVPTDTGRVLIEQARHMALRAEEIERQVLGADRELTGPLRVTTAFAVMEHLLPQPLADFARAYPKIEVEVIENAYLIDLASRHRDDERRWGRREADVGMRMSPNVAEYLVGRQLGITECAVFALRGAPGLPQQRMSVEQLTREAPWVAFERGAASRMYDVWMHQQLARANIRVRVDIFNAKAAMLNTGIGVGILPTFMRHKHPHLVQVSDIVPELSIPLWMITHPDLRNTARVRAFMRFVGDAIAQRLEGELAGG